MTATPCACGGTIWARTSSPIDAGVAIRIHNKTPEHEAWRRRHGIA